MKSLFIQAYLNGDYTEIVTKIAIVGILWCIVVIACIIDLFFGIKKARRLKNLRTSIGFRKTVKKLNQYAFFLFFAFMLDIILSLWFEMPYSTALMSAYLLFIESISVWESLEKNDKQVYKEKASEFLDLLAKLKDEDKTKFIESIKNKLDEKD